MFPKKRQHFFNKSKKNIFLHTYELKKNLNEIINAYFQNITLNIDTL
jgi:hypothetical protein